MARFLGIFWLALSSAVASELSVKSIECWQNPHCDTAQDHCYNQEYELGSCYPKAGSNFSVKYTCTASGVRVESYEGYGCIGAPTLYDYPVGKCVEAVRGFNTIYSCSSPKVADILSSA